MFSTNHVNTHSYTRPNKYFGSTRVSSSLSFICPIILVELYYLVHQIGVVYLVEYVCVFLFCAISNMDVKELDHQIMVLRAECLLFISESYI